MPIFHIIILALVQGITEFLPISSSGHLALTHVFLGEEGGLQDVRQELIMDVAVHVGTLIAVLLYFRREIGLMLSGAYDKIRHIDGDEGTGLLIHVIVGSIPVIIAGLLMHLLIHSTDAGWMRSVELIGWTTLIFGILLGVADRRPMQRTLTDITWKDALLIGLAQVLALIPGTSRSGITMTMARWQGINRTDSARFSLLLAIVATSGAGILEGVALLQTQDSALMADAILAAILALFAALAAIDLMMKWLAKATFMPFVIYRILLGVVLLGAYYGGVLAS